MKTLYILLFAMLAPLFINAQAPSNIIKRKAIRNESAILGDLKSQNSAQENMPQFTGGMSALENYIAENIIYPEEAKNENIEGKVVVEFVVNKKGKVTKEKIIQSVHPSLDNETIRIIKQMPQWEPAKKKGKATKTKLSLPILFSLYK